MQTLLNDIIAGHVFTFLLIFTRFGTALMIMPGVGDTFVSPNIRLLFAIALSFVVTPFLAPHIPTIPGSAFPRSGGRRVGEGCCGRGVCSCVSGVVHEKS